jgi:hypothetical protein
MENRVATQLVESIITALNTGSEMNALMLADKFNSKFPKF